MEKEIAAATAKVKTSIGKGELRLVYGDYTFPLTLRNPRYSKLDGINRKHSNVALNTAV